MRTETKVVPSAAAKIRDGNPEPRLPCVVLLDVSASMAGRKIEELNAGLVTLRDELLKDEQTAQRVEVAVYGFDSEVKVVRDFVSAAQFEPPVLSAGGTTAMAAAILRGYADYGARKARYEATDLDSYGPWIFMVTDGEPTDSHELLEQAKRCIREGESRPREKQIAFFPVGVEGANMQRLAWLSVREPLMLQGYNFRQMFAWLGQSLRKVSQSEVGEEVDLPNPLGARAGQSAMFLIVEQTGNEISLLPPIKQGGEGSIHPITGQPGMVAKVFTQPTTERAEKLRAMLDNQPILTGNAVLLAWPVDRLFTPSGECVGYVMPYAKDKETFYKIAQPGTRPQWANYRFLLRTAKNIAIAVSAFHRHGYVLGDINEFNILVGPDASVAVVDTDSVQVRAGHQIFRCQVGKDGFTPPELIRPGMSYGNIDRYQHNDAFGLAVLIFQLLMDGNHPFGAQYLGTGARPSLTDRIAQGCWPHGKNRNALYRPRRDAPPLESLSPELQRLMQDCFEAGHKNPTCRPTPDDWCKALTEAETEWDNYPARLRYFYYRKLNGRECLKTFLEAFEWLRPAAARVPRNVWAASCGVTAILVFVLLCLSWLGHSEPATDGPQRRGITTEGTPRLWRDIQDPRLLPDYSEPEPNGQAIRGKRSLERRR